MKNSMLSLLSLFFAVCCLQNGASAGTISKPVEYMDGETALEGFLAYDESAAKSSAPAVIIVHEWNGPGDYVKSRALQIAAMGYVAFCADIYGKDVRPKTREESAKTSSIYKSDRQLLRRRAGLAFSEVKKIKFVDPKRIAVMGYCFGGGAALELARSGAELAGAVSFHGNLDTKTPEDAKNIKCRILILHGADDPSVPPAQVAAFKKEMDDARVDWQMVSYGGAVHAFTNPASGNDASRGAAYNEKADKRSFEALKVFLKEIFN